MMPQNNVAIGYIEKLQKDGNRLEEISNSIKKYNQCLEYCRSGNIDMAKLQLKKVLASNPKLIKGYHLLSLIYIHEEEYEKALAISKALFSGNIKEIPVQELGTAFKGVPSSELSSDKNIVDVLVESSFCSSKREAREMIQNGSISINGDKVTDLEFVVTKGSALGGKYTIIRRGKKKYHMLISK